MALQCSPDWLPDLYQGSSSVRIWNLASASWVLELLINNFGRGLHRLGAYSPLRGCLRQVALPVANSFLNGLYAI